MIRIKNVQIALNIIYRETVLKLSTEMYTFKDIRINHELYGRSLLLMILKMASADPTLHSI